MESDHRILRTRWTDLSCYELADLLFALNYVGFGLGAGCFFQCHEELKYREFNEFYPLCLGSGKAGIKHLARNYSPQKVVDLWVAARSHGLSNPDRKKDAFIEARTEIEALLLEIVNKE